MSSIPYFVALFIHVKLIICHLYNNKIIKLFNLLLIIRHWIFMYKSFFLLFINDLNDFFLCVKTLS